MFEKIELAQADPILGLNDAFKKDPNPGKINLGVGVYKTEEGDTPVLECVKKAEKIILDTEKTKNYLGIQGIDEYCSLVRELVFGKSSEILNAKRAVTAQTPGGTGALHVAADFIHKFFPQAKIWISDPTWENHVKIFSSVGIETQTYPYYDPSLKGLNFEKFKNTISEVPREDVVLFHACCHNPTGTDFSGTQWQEIANIAAKKGFSVLFDFAYQGFGNGLDEDATGIRIFTEKNKNFFVATSYSKNFGVYNERAGALTVVAESSTQADHVLSQLKLCARTNYSNPPAHGATIVTTILLSPELRNLWEKEVSEMRNRINNYRKLFVETLKTKSVKQDFSFIINQRGMFSYTGLTKEQVAKLRDKYAIYMVSSGRINVAGLNKKNIGKVCDAIADVLGN